MIYHTLVFILFSLLVMQLQVYGQKFSLDSATRFSKPDTQYTYRTIQVSDTVMVRKLTEHSLSSSHSLSGHLELSLSFESPKQIILIQNGTEVCRISAEYTELFLKQNPDFFSRSPFDSMIQESELNQNSVSDIFSLSKIRKYGAWKTGISIDYGYEFEVDKLKLFWYQGHLSLSMLHQIESLYLGGTLTFNDYEGDLLGPEYSFQFLDLVRENYGTHYKKAGFSLTAGFDFLRYELSYDPWPVPEYYWLEVKNNFRSNEYQYRYSLDSTNTDTSFAPEGNIFLRPMYEIHTKQLSENFSHSLYVKAGIFRYHLLYDKDIYLFPIHNFYIADLPAIWGSWGFGVTNSAHIWVPHIYIESSNSLAKSLFINGYQCNIYTPKIRTEFIYHSSDYFIFRLNMQFFFNYQKINGGAQ